MSKMLLDFFRNISKLFKKKKKKNDYDHEVKTYREVLNSEYYILLNFNYFDEMPARNVLHGLAQKTIKQNIIFILFFFKFN